MLKSYLDKMYKKSENDEAVAFAQKEKILNLEKYIDPEVSKARAAAIARAVDVTGIEFF